MQKQSHIRVYMTHSPDDLDSKINKEIEAGGYVVSSVSLTVRGEFLVALVAFDHVSR